MKYLKKFEKVNSDNTIISNSYFIKLENSDISIYNEKILDQEYNITEEDDLIISATVKWHNYIEEKNSYISLSPTIDEINLHILKENYETRETKEFDILINSDTHVISLEFSLDNTDNLKTHLTIGIRNIEIDWKEKKVLVIF